MDKKLIGVDLGGTTIKFAILTQDGEVQQKWSIKTNILDEGSHIVPDIIESINHHLNLYEMKPEQFIGIGMGTPGTVDVEKGTVIGAYNLNWKTLQNVKEEVEKGTGIAFALDNDANVAALGEQWKGGYLCTCGNRGCLETYASATGVVRVARDMAEEFAGKSALKDAVDNGDDVTSKMVFDLAKEDDVLAVKVVDRVCRYLGLACANISSILHPEYIVIGGGVSAAGNFLLEQVAKYFKQYAFPTIRNTTKIKLARLGNDAGVIGAASLALKFKD